MIRFGSLALDGSPRIAVPFRDTHDSSLIAEAVQGGCDIAELRIDQFANRDEAHVLEEVKRYGGMPVLATIRSAVEGGQWADNDAARLALYSAVIPSVSSVDIELSSISIIKNVISVAHKHEKPAIVSFHDFTRTPGRAELDDVSESAREFGADIVKVATMCGSRADIQTLAGFTLDHADEGVVVIGMGSLGIPTRIFFPVLGSLFTFAAFGNGSAPGQLQLDETRRLLTQFL